MFRSFKPFPPAARRMPPPFDPLIPRPRVLSGSPAPNLLRRAVFLPVWGSWRPGLAALLQSTGGRLEATAATRITAWETSRFSSKRARETCEIARTPGPWAQLGRQASVYRLPAIRRQTKPRTGVLLSLTQPPRQIVTNRSTHPSSEKEKKKDMGCPPASTELKPPMCFPARVRLRCTTGAKKE